MMYPIFISILSLIIIAWPTTGLAHVLVNQNTVGAVLHIAPDDNPYAGVDSRVMLTFKDTAGRFTVADCDCRLELHEKDQLIDQSTVEETGTDTGTATITFPRQATYDLKIIGQPRTTGQFEAFTITHTVNVARSKTLGTTAVAEQFRLHLVHVVLTFIAISAFIYLVHRQDKETTRTKTADKQP